jgi:uncharacterized membrane protein
VGAIAVMIAFWILAVILAFISGGLGILVGLLFPLIGLGIFVLVIVCMVKAYKNEKFKLPIIGDIAEKMAGN